MRPTRLTLCCQWAPLCWLIALAFLFFLPSLRGAQQDNEPVIRFVRNPDPAPGFKLVDLQGQPITLDEVRGKVVFLNFWATWCGPCRAEVPDLVALQAQYKGRLQIIGLDVDDDDSAEVQQYVKETGINYPVVMSSDAVRMEYGGIPALPTSFVLDTEGRIVQKHVGLRNPAVYEMEIRSLLGLPIKARVETFEDTGEVFLKHADRATELPGVDLSKLGPEQKKIALRRLNAVTCTCGCKFTLAQCRIWDPPCAISKAEAKKIVANVAGISAVPREPLASPKTDPARPAASPEASPKNAASRAHQRREGQS
jgi:thiol-disulfide isomerase/thioredoxin